jgi:small subunit ribosomal protein S10
MLIQKTLKNKNIKIVRLIFRSFDHNILDSFLNDFLSFLTKNNIEFIGPVMLPLKRKVFTLLKAFFIYKRHKEHYEIRTYTRLIDLKIIDENTIFNIRHYIISDMVELYSMEEK